MLICYFSFTGDGACRRAFAQPAAYGRMGTPRVELSCDFSRCYFLHEEGSTIFTKKEKRGEKKAEGILGDRYRVDEKTKKRKIKNGKNIKNHDFRAEFN